jgi:hypothetical protein
VWAARARANAYVNHLRSGSASTRVRTPSVALLVEDSVVHTAVDRRVEQQPPLAASCWQIFM